MAITTVFGRGTSSAESETVCVEVNITQIADSSEKAKIDAKLKMDKLYAVIRDLQANGVKLSDDGLASHFSISPVYKVQGELRVHVGYQANFTLMVESGNTDRASEIFEKLSSVEGAAVDSPSFRISSSSYQKLKNYAFIQAIKAAKARFAFQCEVIGFNPNSFEISNWRYDSPDLNWAQGKRLSISETALTIKGGRAEVQTTVYLTYERKSGDTTQSQES
jgi:uncharacterized protein YggE